MYRVNEPGYDLLSSEVNPNALRIPSCLSDSSITQFSYLLHQAIQTVKELPTEQAAGIESLQELQNRLQEGRFHLAILGQFKRGKSTLLNALIGQNLLPTSVVPLTAIPTFLQYREETLVRITFTRGQPEAIHADPDPLSILEILSQYVTEKANHQNRLGVNQVEVSLPAPLLKSGMVLIDTPGIGSTFRHNTDATLNFLPQCDAALFLISADPPMTEVEVQFLQEVRTQIPRLFFILNKVDYLSELEKREALQFFHQVLREQVGFQDEIPIFPVSAKMGLEAKEKNDPERWKQSGLEAIEHYLLHFLASEKNAALLISVSRKAERLVSDILFQCQLSLRSLRLPLEDLERRFQIFEQKLKEAEIQRTIAQDLIAGDQKRMVDFLEKQASEIQQKANRHYQTMLQKVFALPPNEWKESAIQESVAEALPTFFAREHIEFTQTIDRRVKDVFQAHQQRVDDLIDHVQSTASEIFEISDLSRSGSTVPEFSRKPYWVTHSWSTTITLMPDHRWESLLPEQWRIVRIRKRIEEQIRNLVGQNVENLRWSALQNLNRTFRQFSLRLDRQLQETIAATYGAIQSILQKRKEHSQMIAEEIARLEQVEHQLQNIRQSFQHLSNEPERKTP